MSLRKKSLIENMWNLKKAQVFHSTFGKMTKQAESLCEYLTVVFLFSCLNVKAGFEVTIGTLYFLFHSS